MKADPTRQRVELARMLLAVIDRGRSLDREFLHRASGWDTGSKARSRELLWGTVRWYGYLEQLIAFMTGRSVQKLPATTRALLALGLYQLWQMRTAEHAVIKQTVDAVAVAGQPRLKGLANALLRRFQREGDALRNEIDMEPSVAAMPDWIYEAIARDWPQAAPAILAASQARAPMWLRINRMRTDPKTYIERLQSELPTLEATATELVPDAVLLSAPTQVTALPGWETGDVSVQDAAAQLVAEFVDPAPGHRVLDACAAPGGKAAHLAERLGGDLDLTAIDVDGKRMQRVTETFERLGLAARLVTASALDTDAWWDGRAFDRILIDAPCSASGVMRRHPDIKFTRRPGDIAQLAETQSALLAALWPLLASGGRMIYTTCSIFEAENSAVLNEFVGKHSNAYTKNKLPNASWDALMVPRGVGYQVLPGTEKFDGFFYGCIEKH